MAFDLGREVNRLGDLLIRQGREQKKREEILDRQLREDNDGDSNSENQTGKLQGD